MPSITRAILELKRQQEKVEKENPELPTDQKSSTKQPEVDIATITAIYYTTVAGD